jgi:hypothetical protein
MVLVYLLNSGSALKSTPVQDVRLTTTSSDYSTCVLPFATTWGSSHAPAPSEQQTLQGVPPSCCGRRVAVWTGVCDPTIRVWRSGTTCKQPANLAVEGAEESLSILPDYISTVRPRPSALDHLGATC